MRLGCVIIHVPDVPAALVFYQRAFGFERRFVAPMGEYGELQTGGTALAFAAEALIAQHEFDVRENRPECLRPEWLSGRNLLADRGLTNG